jgi:sec-independent protein translocase protein TatC
MVFLAKIGVVDVPFLNKNRKYAILINFIIAAILTPTPDIVNQMLMGVPLLVLYEISVVAVWIFGRKKLKYASQPEPEDDAAEEQEVESAVEKEEEN